MNGMMKNSFGAIKMGKSGFSWTTLFFGIFPALFRGDFKWALIMFLIGFFTGGLSWLVFPFIYNKLYMNDLITSGYRPTEESYAEFLRMKGIFIPELA